MSTAQLSAFYDVDDVLLQNRLNTNMTRMVNFDSPRKITGMTMNNLIHHIPPQQQQQCHHHHQNQQFRSRTGSISSTSSVQSDNSGHSFNSSSMSMGSPSSSVISSHGGSMPSSPVDYRKLDRSVSEVGTDSSRMRDRQDQANKAASQGQSNINSSRYKTELCRPFEENGYCKYGDKCQFAHGSTELRSLNRHPKYKTELCRTYHTIGFCPYGPRCHFIHNDEERRLAQQNQQQQAALQSLKQQMGSQPPQHHQCNTPASPSHPQPQFSAGQPSHMLPQHHHAAPQQPQQQASHHHATLPHHLRPKSLNFNLLQMQRDSLGSTADSPPSSVTDSPTMSPTFFGEEMLMGSAFSPIPASAPATLQPNSAFPFQDLGVMPAGVSSSNHQVVVPTPQQPVPSMAPLNVQTTDPMVNLAAQIHAITLANQRNNNINTNDALLRESLDLLSMVAPPSPPESLASSSSSDSISGTCGSPLEVSRSLRLPIFSKLSCSDDSD